MRLIPASAAALAALLVGTSTRAQPPTAPTTSAPASASAAAASGPYTTDATDIGTLLDDPAASAVVDKYIPDFSTNPQTSLARQMTLKQVQVYSPTTITDAVLAKIDAGLAKLPVKK